MQHSFLHARLSPLSSLLVIIAKEELHNLLGEDLLRNALLLVYLNKQDLPNPLTEEEAVDKLSLNTLPEDRRWHLQPCSAVKNEGLTAGLDWVIQQIHSR